MAREMLCWLSNTAAELAQATNRPGGIPAAETQSRFSSYDGVVLIKFDQPKGC
jgi:hypothetical protein